MFAKFDVQGKGEVSWDTTNGEVFITIVDEPLPEDCQGLKVFSFLPDHEDGLGGLNFSLPTGWDDGEYSKATYLVGLFQSQERFWDQIFTLGFWCIYRHKVLEEAKGAVEARLAQGLAVKKLSITICGDYSHDNKIDVETN